MTCNQMKDALLDLAQTPASTGVSPDAQEHLRDCPACAAELESLRRTMSVLDEWKAPGPSPYFDSRLRARLRDEATKGPGLLELLRRPALAAAFSVLFFAALFLFQGGSLEGPSAPPVTHQAKVVAPSGAVEDLKALDNDYDLYAEFEVLDDLDQNGNGAQVNQ